MPETWTRVDLIRNFGQERKYTHISEHATISELRLIHYFNYHIIEVKVKDNDAAQRLRNILEPYRFNDAAWHPTTPLQCQLFTSNLSTIDNFIEAISRAEPDFELIKNEALCYFHYDGLGIRETQPFEQTFPSFSMFSARQADITQTHILETYLNRGLALISAMIRAQINPYRSVRNNSTFQNVLDQSFADEQQRFFSSSSRSSSSAPSLSRNQTILDEIGVTEIPKEYLCVISQAVMDKPVFDPNSPFDLKSPDKNTMFDQAQILHWLSTANTNPCTRQPLEPEKLVVNEELLNEINAFVLRKQLEIPFKFLAQRYFTNLAMQITTVFVQVAMKAVETELAQNAANNEPDVNLQQCVKPILYKHRIRKSELNQIEKEAKHFTGSYLPSKRQKRHFKPS